MSCLEFHGAMEQKWIIQPFFVQTKKMWLVRIATKKTFKSSSFSRWNCDDFQRTYLSPSIYLTNPWIEKTIYIYIYTYIWTWDFGLTFETGIGRSVGEFWRRKGRKWGHSKEVPNMKSGKNKPDSCTTGDLPFFKPQVGWCNQLVPKPLMWLYIQQHVQKHEFYVIRKTDWNRLVVALQLEA